MYISNLDQVSKGYLQANNRLSSSKCVSMELETVGRRQWLAIAAQS